MSAIAAARHRRWDAGTRRSKVPRNLGDIQTKRKLRHGTPIS
jgi:hypothetical protein